MAFVKVVKNKAYHKRYQVKLRRRREGKTDYQARRALIIQDKNKYNTPKYRLVVRFTNKDIICQVIYSKMVGDIVVVSAYSHELKHYGLTVGLTNWAAAYCCGLLVARRMLKKVGLAEAYEGSAEPDGEDYHVEPEDDENRPFTCYLDTGLVRTSTGARVFGALKGACDGGLDVPHKPKRFAGYDVELKELDAELLRGYIYGEHVSEHMRMLMEEDEEAYNTIYAGYIAADKGDPDEIEDMYMGVHQKIRASPDRVVSKKPEYPVQKRFRPAKRSYAQRKARVAQRKAYLVAKKEQGEDSDEDAEEEYESDE